jgi:tetratricopeptide (TPR) repeat protein
LQIWLAFLGRLTGVLRTLALCVAAAVICGVVCAPRAHAQPEYAQSRAARLIARGQLLQEGGDTISALAYFRDAISAAPRQASGYVALGALYRELNEPQRALEVYEAGSRWAGRDEALWLGLAATLQALGQHERALTALRQLHALDPGARAGLAALADATEARGSFVEALAARRALADLLSREPTSEAVTAALTEQRARVRALSYLLGGAERVRGKPACAPEQVSVVRRALARCP